MSTLNDKANAMVNGLQKGMPAGTTAPLMVNGQPVTVKAAIATLSAYLAAVAAEAPAKLAYHQAVQTAQSQEKAVQQLVAGLSEALRYLFGKGSPELAQFGVSTGVPGRPSAATKALAANKALATRAVNHPKTPKVAVVAATAKGPVTGNSGSGQ